MQKEGVKVLKVTTKYFRTGFETHFTIEKSKSFQQTFKEFQGKEIARISELRRRLS